MRTLHTACGWRIIFTLACHHQDFHLSSIVQTFSVFDGCLAWKSIVPSKAQATHIFFMDAHGWKAQWCSLNDWTSFQLAIFRDAPNQLEKDGLSYSEAGTPDCMSDCRSESFQHTWLIEVHESFHCSQLEKPKSTAVSCSLFGWRCVCFSPGAFAMIGWSETCEVLCQEAMIHTSDFLLYNVVWYQTWKRARLLQ